MLRRLIRHPVTQRLLARLLALYLSLVFRTTRWTLLGEEHLRAGLRAPDGRPRAVIGAFWHERLPLMPALWRQTQILLPEAAGMRVHVLVSRHRDGRFIGEIVGRFGIGLVHASTNRGGATGLRNLLRLLAGGDPVVITPDGPRGPRRQPAPGVAQLAAASGLPVVPCAAGSSRAWVLRSWDRMVVPLPFARGVLVVGTPISVARDAPLASLPAIADALTDACDRADAWVAGRGWLAAT